MGEEKPIFVRWLLDVEELWPGAEITEAAGNVVLQLVSVEERRSILSKFFVKDARMSLGSALLKRLFLCRCLGEPWDTTGNRFGRKGDPVHGKPCVLDPLVSRPTDLKKDQFTPMRGVEFNVSHQAGLVVLVGHVSLPDHAAGTSIELGIDVVCVDERDDYRAIRLAGGLAKWVDGFETFFAPSELDDIKYNVDCIRLGDGQEILRRDIDAEDIRCCSLDEWVSYIDKDGSRQKISSAVLVEAKLRRFYAFFAYREAFVKLTGDALLAAWLRDLEVRHVRTPSPLAPKMDGQAESWGERIEDTGLSYWLHGQRLNGLRTEVRAYGLKHMIATAIRIKGEAPEVAFEGFDCLELRKELARFCPDQY